MIGLLLGNALSNKANAQRFVIQNGQIYQQPDSKINQLLQLINASYVESINLDSITEEVMQEMVQKLDPHSAYIPKKDLEMVNSELSASFSGIGVQFSIMNDTVHIVAVISGGPCEGLGVMAGDKIITVDDSVFTGKQMTNEKVMHSLRGEKGTLVKLGIMRQGESELLSFTVTRGDIPVHSVDAKFIVSAPKTGEKIGFVRVNKFGENTYEEFLSALNTLKNQGATSYIVDLRENSGGYMDQAIKMANEFLPAGAMIVYAKGRAYPKFEATATGTGRFKKAKLVVLIDDFSASASEIFAGAMQDNDRATIVGRRSFGKGLVQQQMPLMDGSAVRLTVARYYTPSGRCIQKPYTMGDQEDYAKELYERYERGEFFSQDSISYPDTTVYYTQSGRVVHGGGGIMPDVFVGRDTSLVTPYYNRIINRGLTYQFALRYTDEHRKELSRYTSWSSLENHLLQTNWMPELVQFCQDKGIAPNDHDLAISRLLLQRLVNAYIVRNLLGDEGFYPLFERDDEISRAALEQF